jgi:hypothetical protein
MIDQAGTGDRACIHHGIERLIFSVKPDRIEGFARLPGCRESPSGARTDGQQGRKGIDFIAI